MAVTGVYLLGWLVLFYATCLNRPPRPVRGEAGVAAFTNQSYIAPQFYTPGMYRFVRHPLYSAG
jgi:hypothetical protein